MEQLEQKFGIPSSPLVWRKFGYLMCLVLGGLSAYAWWQDWFDWTPLAIVAGGFGVMGFLWPTGLRPVHVIWMIFAHALGAVVSRVILSVFYFVLIFPLGLFMKLFFGSMLTYKKKNSYWEDKVIDIDSAEDYENQF